MVAKLNALVLDVVILSSSTWLFALRCFLRIARCDDGRARSRCHRPLVVCVRAPFLEIDLHLLPAARALRLDPSTLIRVGPQRPNDPFVPGTARCEAVT